jgi:Cu-Zn family superoxide dismutase
MHVRFDSHKSLNTPDCSPIRQTSSSAIMALLLILTPACRGGQDRPVQETPNASSPSAVTAGANLQPTVDSRAEGAVNFTHTDDGVRVEAEIRGLSPGAHGFHIHEVGDCSAPDGSSAGGHFNPVGSPHGPPSANASARHAGDLGNLVAGPDSIATLTVVDPVIKLTGDESIVGHGVIVHAGEDDLVTQPTGAAGKRAACGVIEAG